MRGESDPAVPARWSRRRKAILLLVLALVLLASPPVRSRIKAALLIAEVLPSPVQALSLITPDPSRIEMRRPPLHADVYDPRGYSTAPGIVLVHGANPDGKDDPRVISLADALARTGRRVIVPQLGLRDQRLDPDDPEKIREAVRFMSTEQSVSVLAFSYGGGLAVVALAKEPKLQEDVSAIATMGTYFDALHLIQGVTTATVPYHGRAVPWETEAEAIDVLAEQLSSFLDEPRGPALRRAWQDRDPSGLDPDTEAVYEVLANRDPHRFDALAAAMPEDLKGLLASLSPATVIDAIEVPLFALHSTDDPAAPPTESQLMVEALSGRVPTRYLEVEIFEHVSPTASPLTSLRDGRRLLRFASLLLGSQEGWPRP